MQSADYLEETWQTDTEVPAVLALSGHRPEKFITPLLGSAGKAVAITNTDSSLIRRTVQTLYEGVRRCRNDRPDVIVADHGGVLAFVAILLGGIFRRPVIVRIGGEIWQINREKATEYLEEGSYRQWGLITVFRVLNRFTFWLADGFLVLSDHLERRTIDETGCDPAAVEQIGVPVDVDASSDGDEEAAREALGITEPRVITTVTNLRFEGKYEGVRTTLPAVEQVLRDNPNVAFVVAGAGRYLDSLRRAIEKRFAPDLHDRVYAPGFVNNVSGLYAASDIALYASYIDGSPNVIREAQAAGLPVVTISEEGLAEQVDDGETGRIVDDSTEAIQTALNELIASPRARAQLGRRGQEMVRDHSNSETVGQEIHDALRKLVNRSGG